MNCFLKATGFAMRFILWVYTDNIKDLSNNAIKYYGGTDEDIG
jgi:hypothetical protein